MFHAVILAGGGGTRLWPASRRRRPKQFLPLGKHPGETLIAATNRRLGELAGAAHTWVVTAADQAAEVARALPSLPAANILSEPCARNTAAAIGLAAVHLLAVDPDAVLGVLPADHHIGDEEGFRAVVGRAFALAARKEVIVTVGISPTGPETGFGYLEAAPKSDDADELGARAVIRFVEKPDRATALRYVADGYLWNAGMFFVGARVVRAEIARHLPELSAGLDEIAAGIAAGNGAEVTARVYPRLPAISFDYGVMERTTGTLAVAADFGWNDVGAWSALGEYRTPDDDGNVTDGLVLAHDAHGNIAVGDPGKLIALVGVSGLVVVQAGDAVLVVPRERAQDVREIVKRLQTGVGLDKYL